MSTITKFEDLLSWQRARELTKRVYEITKQKPFCFDRGLKSQIQRAAVSVMANQAEGFTRGTRVELINYFYIAKGSAGEVQSHLYTAVDAGYIDMATFQELYGLADEAQRLIQSFVYKVKEGSRKGIQHRPAGMEKRRKIIELQELIAKKKMAGEDADELQKELLRIEGFL
ncbi:MAG: four helix bundle protein [Patescibacteria group bacterium]|nr:four helix bundle protein [Patescibacteria group bacterium]